MPSSASGSLLALCTLTALLSTVSDVVASPKVVGFDFEKQMPRDTPMANRLRRRQKSLSVDIDNEDIAYVINMTVGTPPQSFSVQLDTGSSDIWIPSVNSAVCRQDPDACGLGEFNSQRSSTFKEVDQGGFEISYEDNSGVEGDYINETLTLNGGKTTIQNMTMGLALKATRGFGIMGIGYDADESVADPREEYPNIIAQLQAQGFINTLAYSLWLNDLDASTGSILFGGIDTDKFHGDIVVLPVQKSSNNTYTDFTVALTSVSLMDAAGKTGFSQTNLALPVILDSGTTATYLPDSVINPILSGIGAVNNAEIGGPIVPCSLTSSPANFTFGFGGNGGPMISVSLAEFLDPVYNEDNTPATFKSGDDICSFGIMSSGTGPILFGDSFLRSAYVVYDLTNNQIGLAQTNFNATSSNVVEISGSAIPSATATATGVAVTQTYTGHPQETAMQTERGGGQTVPVPTQASATFNLGATATGKSDGSSKKSAAVALGFPNIEGVTIVTGMVCLLSMIFGSSMVLMV